MRPPVATSFRSCERYNSTVLVEVDANIVCSKSGASFPTGAETVITPDRWPPGDDRPVFIRGDSWLANTTSRIPFCDAPHRSGYHWGSTSGRGENFSARIGNVSKRIVHRPRPAIRFHQCTLDHPSAALSRRTVFTDCPRNRPRIRDCQPAPRQRQRQSVHHNEFE